MALTLFDHPVDWKAAFRAKATPMGQRRLDIPRATAQSALPTVSRTRVGSPGWFTAKVRGRVYASDADRDKLTFTAANTARGTVTVNSRGSFTYTPTDAARHAAAATAGEDRDTFVIAVGDGAADGGRPFAKGIARHQAIDAGAGQVCVVDLAEPGRIIQGLV